MAAGPSLAQGTVTAKEWDVKLDHLKSKAKNHLKSKPTQVLPRCALVFATLKSFAPS